MLTIPDFPGEAPAPVPGASTPTHSLQIDLAGFEPEQLLELRHRIDSLLPVKRLTDLNMEEELVIQLLTVQQLQRETLNDEHTPATQKSATANAVAAALGSLVRLQSEVHTSERLKRIEQALVEAVKTLPADAQNIFLDGYERRLAGL